MAEFNPIASFQQGRQFFDQQQERAAVEKDLRAQAEKFEHDPHQESRFQRDKILPLMTEIRGHADKLEGVVDDGLWPLPKYGELLYVH